MSVGPRVKMIVGALLILLGVWWYLPGGDLNSMLTTYSTLTNYESLMVGIQGAVGIILALIGLFVVWIEHDEIKLRRELDSEDFGRRVQHSVKAVAESANEEDEPMHGEITEHTGETSDDTGKENGFTCEECGRSFDTKRGLSVHTSQAH